MFTDDREELRAELAKVRSLQAETLRILAGMHAGMIIMRGQIVALQAHIFGLSGDELKKVIGDQVEQLSTTMQEATAQSLIAAGYVEEPPPDDPYWDRPESGGRQPPA